MFCAAPGLYRTVFRVTTPPLHRTRVTGRVLTTLSILTLAFLPFTIFLPGHPTCAPLFLLYVTLAVPLAASFLCYATAHHSERLSNA